MQKVDLICIGKLNAPYFAAGVAEYQKRLGNLCEFRIIELPEETISEKNASAAVIEKALEKEAKAILSNLRKGSALIALCVEGKLISSEDLAADLANRAVSGAGDVTFVIGSSHGLSPTIKKMASAKISLGRITLPHQLARLVLTEQIYRAFAINHHIKYHK
ncbi:MAG: 23S rRNA (pseudouridine(1915)-N(3))-methyltransferase RlmH [Candidatus Fournierella pullistercoris]|uniref:Ribosomal RNA large subunit methyltransferase H n=1 Tax=Candidatus Allofournierella pullistercoris TaxID=2838597 RepID=A0A948WU71_9FIRM|nr:23S rRNA (pseudouridine(1915)-N(3))-methyltransferase RlmH [Candidatus Fournierella pullistercoris]